VEQRAGRIVALPSKIHDVVAAARVLDHAPTLAAALVIQARIDFAVSDNADAESTLRELAQVAARARDDRAAAFAWIELIGTIGSDQGKFSEARALVPMAAAAVLRAGDPPELRADLLYSQAGLERTPDPQAALELLTRVRALLERSGAASPGSPLARRLVLTLSEVAAVRADLGDHDGAIASYRDAIARWRALYGDDSPDEAFTLLDLASSLDAAGKHDDSIAAYRHALAIREARLGDSMTTAYTREFLAMALHTQGRWEEAMGAHDGAIRSYRARVPGSAQLARVLGNRAETLVQLGRFAEAAQGYDEALALLERDDHETFSRAMTLYNRGELQRRRARCPDALRDFARAADLAASLHDQGSTILIHALVGEAGCLLAARRHGEAIARLGRALELKASPDAAFQVALARAYLG
ncbi:MAG: tetratricopeptide repeat protein, partial [Solirubrobacteraceae bacterium]